MNELFLAAARFTEWPDSSPDSYFEYEYTTTGGEDFGGLLLLLGGLLLIFSVFLVAIYIVGAIFQMRLMKAAGHRTPGAAWVPIWSTAALLETAGLRGPWPWVGVLFGASFLGGLIPYVGILVTIATSVISVMLFIWAAKGIQAGTGLDSTGGIVLAVFMPLIWLIWMGVRAPKTGYDREAAIAAAGTFPIRWFDRVGDPRAPFSAGGAR